MAKRTIEAVLYEIKQFRDGHGASTLQAMAATMNEREFDDLLTLVERFQNDFRAVSVPQPKKA